MENKSSSFSKEHSAQVFILTPEELNKFGILDTINKKPKSNNKANHKQTIASSSKETNNECLFEGSPKALQVNNLSLLENPSTDTSITFKKSKDALKFKSTKSRKSTNTSKIENIENNILKEDKTNDSGLDLLQSSITIKPKTYKENQIKETKKNIKNTYVKNKIGNVSKSNRKNVPNLVSNQLPEIVNDIQNNNEKDSAESDLFKNVTINSTREDNDTQLDILEVNLKRKKGRFSKKGSPKNSTALKEVKELPLETSKKGRKCRKIDYSKLNNGDINFPDEENNGDINFPDEENNEDPQNKKNNSKFNNSCGEMKSVSPKKRGRPIKNRIKSNVSINESQDFKKLRGKKRKLSSNNDDDIADEETFEKDQGKGNELSSDLPNKKNSKKIKLDSNEECKSQIETASNDIEVNHQTVKIADKEENNEEKTKVRYNQTGKYSKLVSEVFNASLNEGEDISKKVIHPRPAGRPKKNLEGCYEVDEEDKVQCQICQIKIEVCDWENHNEKKHSNLSWRKGEPVLNLDHQKAKEKIKLLLNKKKKVDCFKCTKSFFKVNEFFTHLEECMGIVKNKNVVCGVCEKTIPQENWSTHKSKHNTLAWRKGEHPLDLTDEYFVLQTLNALYKNKKNLYCDRCDTVKKSVVGLLSHKTRCGIEGDPTVPCNICGKKILPISMPSHIKFVHEDPKPKLNSNESNYFNVDLDATQKKRRAATKALAKLDQFTSDILDASAQFIKNFDFNEDEALKSFVNKEIEGGNKLGCFFKGCEFSCDNSTDLLSHLITCTFKLVENFTCKICYNVESTKSQIIKHLRVKHDLKVKVDEDYDYNENNCKVEDDEIVEEGLSNEKRRPVSTVLVKVKPKFSVNLSRTAKPPNKLFSNAFEYTNNFCQKNYFHKNLFEELKCDKKEWVLINDSDLEKYIPSSEISCDVVINEVNVKNEVISKQNFKKYELFEISNNNGNITIYCGAPIRCMAWQPTPFTSLNETQILAVATSKHFDEVYLCRENYSETTVIQFWNFGLLKNCREMTFPKLEFCLGVDDGPVWHLEWCPSGCYNVTDDVELNRRGLLAVAGSSMVVNIYAIPLMNEEEIGLFYKAKPVLQLKLVLDENNLKNKIFATKIAWSKVEGHNYVAVGYSDGNVALYNLSTLSNLLKVRATSTLLPYKTIKCHSHYITALSLIPIAEGNRWLLTSSLDRSVYVWDLNNDTKCSVKKGKTITDGAWLTNWLCYINVYDESSSVGPVCAAVNSHREYFYEPTFLSYSNSTISALSSSEWLNGILHGNESGEINVFFPHQMLSEMGALRKQNTYRYLMGYMKLIDKTMSPEERAKVDKEKHDVIKYRARGTAVQKYMWYEPLKYKEAIEKYALEFFDTVQLYKSQMVFENSEFCKQNLYPLMAINKVSFNTNRQSSLYYATGYQVGFLRLTYLKYLENDLQIKISQSHNTVPDK